MQMACDENLSDLRGNPPNVTDHDRSLLVANSIDGCNT
jgi:hypothetical protein